MWDATFVSFPVCGESSSHVSREIRIGGIGSQGNTINFRLASAGEAKRLIAAKDSYTANWSPFDIAARLENPEGKREDLVSLAVREVREWTAEEAQQIEQIRKNLNDTIRKYGYRIPFPKEIVLVKTTMKDEGGAGGYTRSNWIALTDHFSAGDRSFSHTPAGA